VRRDSLRGWGELAGLLLEDFPPGSPLRRITIRIMSNTLSIRLPKELDEWLAAEARKTGLPKSRIVREQLEAARTRKARQPFLDLAGSVDGTPGLSRRRGLAR
jgi:hypothetical protein